MEFVYAAIGASRAEDIPYDGSQSIKTKIDSIGLGNVPGLAPGRASQWGMLQVQPGAIVSSMAESGLCEASVYIDSNSSNVSAGTDGVYFNQLFALPRITGNVTSILEARHNPVLVGKIMIATSAQNLALGFGSGAAAANNPAGSFCTMQYRAARDTNFQLMTKDGTTQNVVDTGIAVVTGAVHYFIVDLDFTNTLATLSVYDNTFTLQASVTSAVNLPAAATALNFEHQQDLNDLRTFFLHLLTRSA